jgi:hypothetical protein
MRAAVYPCNKSTIRRRAPMTRTRLALAAGLLTVTAFVAGHQVGRIDTSDPATTAVSMPRAPGKTAKAVAPDPARSAPRGIELDDPTRCGLGGTCLSEKDYLLPLRG